MPSAISKALSGNLPGYEKNIEKVLSYLSVRAPGEVFAPRKLSDGLRVPIDELLTILREMNAWELVEERKVKVCLSSSCQANTLHCTGDEEWSCDLCEEVYEESSALAIQVFVLKENIDKIPTNGDKMFDQFMNDKIALIKKSGETFPNIKAMVEKNMIHIPTANIPVEDGDTIQRKLPTGIIEEYIVVDAGYTAAFMNFDAHYQVKVEKKTATQKRTVTNINNFHHVNVHPQGRITTGDDFSQNHQTYNSGEIFSQMLDVIQGLGPKSAEAGRAIQEMASAKDKASFGTAYQRLMGLVGSSVDIALKLMPLIEKAQRAMGG
jgi:hypothetical protein